MICQWADCSRTHNVKMVDGYAHCPRHLQEHYQEFPAGNHGRPKRTLAPCGTWAAYSRHKRYGETPCEPCTEAMREKGRRRWAKTKQAREQVAA